jgi:hypothetical protein
VKKKMADIQWTKHKKSDNWKAYVAIGIIIVVLVAVYFSFYYYPECNDLSCFYSYQKKCSKVTFINDAPDTTWLYTIKGKQDNKCIVDVEVLMIKQGTADKKKLEGLEMTCVLPLGSNIAPESDINKCHGMLKEELQSLIITKLHEYIVENVQEIGEGLEEIM